MCAVYALCICFSNILCIFIENIFVFQKLILSLLFKISTANEKCLSYFFENIDKSTVKPVLTATSEQRPPVNNDRPESPALL
jgi:hypothetical protein